MTSERRFYRVISDLYHTPLPDPLANGYESRRDFFHALMKIVDQWHGRVGERIDERHGCLLLRFHDTPGSKPDEAWMPEFLLTPVEPPGYITTEDRSREAEIEKELEEAYGFD